MDCSHFKFMKTISKFRDKLKRGLFCLLCNWISVFGFKIEVDEQPNSWDTKTEILFEREGQNWGIFHWTVSMKLLRLWNDLKGIFLRWQLGNNFLENLRNNYYWLLKQLIKFLINRENSQSSFDQSWPPTIVWSNFWSNSWNWKSLKWFW